MSSSRSFTRPRPRGLRILLLSLGALALVALVAISSCGATTPNRDPLGERFPTVAGATLAGDPQELPLAEVCVLLVGYDQDAQFDADRWLVGLLQATPPVRIFEVPTIAGFVPRFLAGKIDTGMRSGIPDEDWGSVITLYGPDAERIVQFTGNEGPRNMRVFLLDSEGQVRWYHDRGFSATKLLELVRSARELSTLPQ